MADIENPISIEKGQDVQGQKPQEAGAFPPGVLDKAREYGVQPSQWQQYGQHIQAEYDKIMQNIVAEYKLLDEVEQSKILRALESGDEHALDDVLINVEAHLMNQDKELPHVLNNLKKVAAKKILDLAHAGKLPELPASTSSTAQDDSLQTIVDILLTFFQAANAIDQEQIILGLKAGQYQVLDTLINKLPSFGYQLESLDLALLKQRTAEKLLS